MLDLLTTHYGVPRDRLAIAGYADTVPVDSNDTPEGRAHNRRVDLVILNQNVLVADPGAVQPKTPQSEPKK
jgi:flagellar motor protein MotB